MAMSIPQQGSGFPFFSKTTYNYLSKTTNNINDFQVILEDIPDPEVRMFLEEVYLHIHITTHAHTYTHLKPS